MAYRSCDYACKIIANKKHHCDYFSHQLCQDSGKLYQRYSFLTYHWGQAPAIDFWRKNLVVSGKMINFAAVISNSKKL